MKGMQQQGLKEVFTFEVDHCENYVKNGLQGAKMEAGRPIKKPLQLARQELMVAYTRNSGSMRSEQMGDLFWRCKLTGFGRRLDVVEGMNWW